MAKTTNTKANTKEEQITAKDGTVVQLLTIHGQNTDKNSKHLVYFIGGSRVLHSTKDYSKNWDWATKQGITVHLFNYPGFGLSKSKSIIRSHRVRAGISVVDHLLSTKIKPDNIILFGDCSGGHVAAEVYKRFKDKGTHLRCIISNAASSLEQASLYYFGFIGKLKIILAPIFKLVLKIFGCHWKTYKIINSITPYTMYFNREDDKTIKKQAQLATKIEKIEESGRKKDYQKKETFTGFDTEFFKQNTILVKDDKLIDPKRRNKDIHKLPITCLKSKSSGLSFPELTLEFIKAGDQYIAEHRPLNTNLSYSQAPTKSNSSIVQSFIEQHRKYNTATGRTL
ncbi:MAG: alpha/beta hydrolase [Wolbachia endosymbiont of Tyrophagus putrescentiae]|nr:alpha/beta hydrolase [Wolbachia endosymbiont of Tyrophagus putrescentiae]